MIRLFAADLDGTLLNNDSKLEQKTIDAIRAFQEQGGIFMVATGRNVWEYSEVKEHVRDVISNCLNGAVLYDKEDREIFSFPVEKEAVRRFDAFVREFDLPVIYHSEGCRYCPLAMEELQKPVTDYLVKEEGFSKEEALEFFHYVFNDGRTVYTSSLEDLLSSRIFKMEVVFIKEKQYPKMINICKELFPDHNVVDGSFYNNIEVTGSKSDKGELIRKYCKLTKIEEDEVAVIGDSGNDIGMLKGFRNSYAMQNAPREVREVATYIADDNDSFGAAKVLEEICRRNREEADA